MISETVCSSKSLGHQNIKFVWPPPFMHKTLHFTLPAHSCVMAAVQPLKEETKMVQQSACSLYYIRFTSFSSIFKHITHETMCNFKLNHIYILTFSTPLTACKKHHISPNHRSHTYSVLLLHSASFSIFNRLISVDSRQSSVLSSPSAGAEGKY